MFNRLSNEMGRARIDDLLRDAGNVAIRPASSSDGAAIDRLADLETAPRPAGEVLLAESDGEVVAALPIDGGRPLADPFRRTVAAVELLALRARQLRRL
jgi:hypothetical protein